MSVGSVCCLLRYSATCLAGNSVSQTYPKSLAKWIASPSTKELKRVTFAAFLLPAGRGRPILSSLLRNIFPPSLDFALDIQIWDELWTRIDTYLRKTPPSKDALRHSGGERRRCTSAIVTLYFEVEDNKDNLPGVEQKISIGNFELICLSCPWPWFCSNSRFIGKGISRGRKVESPFMDWKKKKIWLNALVLVLQFDWPTKKILNFANYEQVIVWSSPRPFGEPPSPQLEEKLNEKKWLTNIFGVNILFRVNKYIGHAKRLP